MKRCCCHSMCLPIALLVISAFCAPTAEVFAQSQAFSNNKDGIGGFPIKGITVGPIESSQFPDRGYGSQSSFETLKHLKRLGATWVSITPFGQIWDLNSTEINLTFEAPYEKNRQGIVAFLKEAKRLGLRTLVIPHLWVETPGLWRGEINFENVEDWQSYQKNYRAFVLSWAEAANAGGADMFSIGVECKSWSGRFGPYWQSLIADVRAVFDGDLTYSANWDEAEDVIFWDLLDMIGVNAFYPLARQNGASDATYLAHAKKHAQKIGQLANTLSRPVVFVEVGYTTRANAAVEPWLWPDGMTNVVLDEHEQARALKATFNAFIPERWFMGFFIWRYYAYLHDVSQEARWGFSPHAKEAAEVLAETFAAPWR